MKRYPVDQALLATRNARRNHSGIVAKSRNGHNPERLP